MNSFLEDIFKENKLEYLYVHEGEGSNVVGSILVSGNI